jgi:arylsulfatase B
MNTRVLPIMSLFVCPLAACVAGDQPNILLLIADDLGVADIGAYTVGPNAVPGSPPSTPVIDSLAANGLLFREAWSAPVCTPTRGSLYTGRYGFRTGVRNVGDVLAESEVTWAELLSDIGYVNGLFGKWHLGRTNAVGGSDAPRVSGSWDDYAGILSGALGDYFDFNEVSNGITQTVENYATTEQVNDALAWITNQTSPWTCTVAFTAPHSPWHVPPMDLHTFNIDEDSSRVFMYRAAVQSMDTEIGRLLDGIGEDLDNTVVIFVGDNGTPGQVTVAPYTTSKGSVHQGGVHVPMIVSAPFMVDAGRETFAPVHVADLFSTILDMTDIDVEQVLPDVMIDGSSLLGLLEGQADEVDRDVIYTEIISDDPVREWFAIRGERYKLLELNGVYEFYDLENDPLEANDLTDGELNPSEFAAFNSLRASLQELYGLEACIADMDEPYGELNFFDVSTFLVAYNNAEPAADLAAPEGEFNFFDVAAFVESYLSGCP